MQSPGPVAFSIGNFDIRWYGVLIAAGMLLAIFISYKRAPEHGLDQDTVLDTCIVMIPVGVIGARLYYVIFNWDYYSGSLMRILDIRSGGLAIHGGLIFGILAVYIMCRIKHTDLLDLLDLFLPTVALAQAIGRWGNFFNEEAHGIETDLPLAVIIDGKAYHPTFLYESIWCLIMFIVLSRIYKNINFRGQTACQYGIMYSFERFFVESLRTDSLMIGPLRQAQVISVLILLFCEISYTILQRREQ